MVDVIDVRAQALNIANAQALRCPPGTGIDPEDVLTRARAYETYLLGPEAKKIIDGHDLTVAARAAHEAIRTLQIQNNEPNVASPWETVGQDIKDSCFIGIERIIKNPEITDEELHDSWINTKTDQGWKYGPTRSEEDKLHPCLVPYSELPPFQRLKDAMFRNVVRAVLGI